MIHLGDITQMKPETTPPVDCITFGSPCQDLSVAGKRAGLAGGRSGLFMDAVCVIKEMLWNSFGQYPKFAVWENVPGAFSSNKGEDFRVVLEELARIKEPSISVPRPENGKWAKAGLIAGNGWSVAWRTFDAQFWGVPQRRRRIAVVMDFGGQRAGEVLFECTGMSRYLEPSIPPWKGIARAPAHDGADHDRVVEGAGFNGYKSVTGSHAHEPVICFGFKGGQSLGGLGFQKECAPMLSANASGIEPTVLRRAHGQSNAETLEALSPTLNSNHEQPIVFENHSQDARYTQQSNTSPTCVARWGTGGNNTPLVVDKCLTPWDHQSRRVYDINGYFPALTARETSGHNQQAILTQRNLRWIVRRLTPTEGERLQGYPDGWTNIGEWYNSTTGQGYWVDTKGKKHKTADSPRYKAIGNSIALPQWWWITCKMAQYLPERATLGSLFDGIGGFPLVWETRHGKGTAVWASEIEEFPIAVTKMRFSE